MKGVTRLTLTSGEQGLHGYHWVGDTDLEEVLVLTDLQLLKEYYNTSLQDSLQILPFLDLHTLFPGAGCCTPTLGTMPGVRQGLMPL